MNNKTAATKETTKRAMAEAAVWRLSCCASLPQSKSSAFFLLLSSGLCARVKQPIHSGPHTLDRRATHEFFDLSYVCTPPIQGSQACVLWYHRHLALSSDPFSRISNSSFQTGERSLCPFGRAFRIYWLKLMPVSD